MSGSSEVSFFNRAFSAFLSIIGTFVLLVRFGCLFKARGARINKTQVWPNLLQLFKAANFERKTIEETDF